MHRHHSLRTLLMGIGTAVTGVLLLFSSCSASSEETSEVPSFNIERKTIPVEAFTLSTGRLIEEVVSSGTIKGVREATIVSETQGTIEEVLFELGHNVKPGETLVQVDEEVARLNMEQAEQQLETARIDLQTKVNLLERGGASRAAVLRARSAFRGAEARYQQAKKAFEDCSIASPISGYVAEKTDSVAIGNYLSPGTPVARVVDLSILRLEVSLSETSIGLVREGAEARVTIPAACERETFTGKVVAVSAGSDPATGSYPVIIQWENTCGPRIKSGMSAEAAITPIKITPLLIVPTSAVSSRGGRDIVFIAESRRGGANGADSGGSGNASGDDGTDTGKSKTGGKTDSGSGTGPGTDGKAEAETTSDTTNKTTPGAKQPTHTAVLREVKTGRSVGSKTELISGAEAGEVVITSGISGLSDGDPVFVRIIGESGSKAEQSGTRAKGDKADGSSGDRK